MATKKKQSKKTAGITSPKVAGVTHPILDYSGQKDEQENELWKKWKVKPDLTYMPAPFRDDADLRTTEVGIAKRIAYCRGQLDNLSVEALARYTKYFDQVGVSKASIVRYEAGESLPGARELRILCDALWVSPNWLLLGTEDLNSQSIFTTRLIDAATLFVLNLVNEANRQSHASFETGMTLQRAQSEIEQRPQKEKAEIERRQQWIDEARKPAPR